MRGILSWKIPLKIDHKQLFCDMNKADLGSQDSLQEKGGLCRTITYRHLIFFAEI